jgi:mycothiol maleylpyruvate isomerase-like protein
VTPRVTEHHDVRTVFDTAGSAFVDVVSTLDAVRLADRATAEWTLRELVAHATRGLLAVETTLATPIDPDSRFLESAADYFAAAMSIPNVHAGIVQRGRDAAAAVGDEPGRYARSALDRVLVLVATTAPDRVVQHFAGRLRFDEYVATRVVELTLHTADVQLVTGADVAFPTAAAALTRDVLLDLVDRVDALTVACALSGRAGSRCNVLA